MSWLLSNPAPTWRFLVQFQNLGDVRAPAPVYVESGNFTHPFIDSEPRFVAGSYTYYPQFNNIDAIDVILLETENYEVLNYLYEWLGLVVHEDGSYGVPIEYKQPTKLTMLDELGNEQLEIIYNGTFPTRIATIDASNNEEHVRINCNFSTDSNTVIFLNSESQSVYQSADRFSDSISQDRFGRFGASRTTRGTLNRFNNNRSQSFGRFSSEPQTRNEITDSSDRFNALVENAERIASNLGEGVEQATQSINTGKLNEYLDEINRLYDKGSENGINYPDSLQKVSRNNQFRNLNDYTNNLPLDRVKDLDRIKDFRRIGS